MTRDCCSTCSASARRPHALPAESYAAYTSTYQWKSIYGWDLLYSGPLFTHQLSHMAVLRLLLKGYILHRWFLLARTRPIR